MIRFAIILCCVLTISLMSGCSLIPPDRLHSSDAAKVFLSDKLPPKDCQYIGLVYGTDGNWFSGFFTSNINLTKGALNNIRNQAADNGANYIYFGNIFATDQSILYDLYSLNLLAMPLRMVTGTFNATYTGSAFYCPKTNEQRMVT